MGREHSYAEWSSSGTQVKSKEKNYNFISILIIFLFLSDEPASSGVFQKNSLGTIMACKLLMAQTSERCEMNRQKLKFEYAQTLFIFKVKVYSTNENFKIFWS